MSLPRKTRKSEAHRKTSQNQKKYAIAAMYLILFALILLYAYSNNTLVGLAIFVSILLIVAVEFKESVTEQGVRDSIIEVASAIIVAGAVFAGLMFILGTSAPLDTVASCSMLPSMSRGDLVVLHGMSNATAFSQQNHIPMVNVSQADFNAMESHMDSEFLAFYAYNQSNPSQISSTIPTWNYAIGLYNTKCVTTYSFLGQTANIARCRVNGQQGNLIQYSYVLENATISGKPYQMISTTSLSIYNYTISSTTNRTVIVYRTNSKDTFSGDIIHRAQAALNVNGTIYFLTKGDNNQAFDIQFGNYPPAESDIVGYMLAKLPVLGYIKLIISGQLAPVQGCDQLLMH